MRGIDTDGEWERFGQSDPYFGVVSHEQFRGATLERARRAEFFETGARHVEELFAAIERHIVPSFAPATALDFGCGVGRVAIPLAARAGCVTGLDIAPSMLAEARRNAERMGVSNLDLAPPGADLATLPAEFDLVHSFIVLQHIPPARGLALFDGLLGRLRPGGIAALHLTYANIAGRWPKLKELIARRVPFAANLYGLTQGRRFSDPVMQMNSYDLNRVFASLYSFGCEQCHIVQTNHTGRLGLMIYARKG
ncbi:MAG: class I SAM-dependent methyltransferase [Pikeienuella sp.]